MPVGEGSHFAVYLRKVMTPLTLCLRS